MKGLLFTYSLVGVGLIAPFFEPFVGLLVYVVFAVLVPQAIWSFSLPSGARFSLVIAISLLGGWAMSGFGSWSLGKAKGVVLALVVFWAWTVVSAAAAPVPQVAWEHVELLSKGLLPCIVAITLIDSVRQLKQLAWALTLCQGYWAVEFNRAYYAGQIIPTEWSFASLDNNSLAILMATSVGLAFFLGLHSRIWWARILAFSAAGLMVHVILFSMSRGGMLALVAVGTVIFLLIPKRPGHFVAFLIAMLVVLRLSGPQVIERYNTIFAKEDARDASAESRVELTKALVSAMLSHPVTGLGPSHWPLHSSHYGFTEGKAGHNTWAQVGAETGIPGAVALLAFYLICVIRLWPLAREQTDVADPWMRFLARAVIASLTGFIISATFVSIEGVELPYYVAIIGAGILKIDSMNGIGSEGFTQFEAVDFEGIGSADENFTSE